MEVDVTGHVGFFDLLELMKLARTKLDNKLAAFHQTIFRLGDRQKATYHEILSLKSNVSDS